jgi:hypothetical protein
MGLGLSAGKSPEHKSYQLSDISMLRFVPADADDETIDEFKDHFCHWIIGNGLRELIESHCVFLDQLNAACLVIKGKMESLEHIDLERRDRTFRHKGLKGKFDLLASEFCLSVPDQEKLTTIYMARNCLSHRRGIVGKEDCGDGGELTIEWIGVDIWAESSDGKKVPFGQPFREPVILEKESGIKMQMPQRRRSFPVGMVVSLSGNELAEICFYAHRLALQFVAAATEYAKTSGVVRLGE